jgi:hypothetical protein
LVGVCFFCLLWAKWVAGFVPVLFIVFSFFFFFFLENFCQICVLVGGVFFELGVFIKLSCVCVCGGGEGEFSKLFLCSCGKEIVLDFLMG